MQAEDRGRRERSGTEARGKSPTSGRTSDWAWGTTKTSETGGKETRRRTKDAAAHCCRRAQDPHCTAQAGDHPTSLWTICTNQGFAFYSSLNQLYPYISYSVRLSRFCLDDLHYHLIRLPIHSMVLCFCIVFFYLFFIIYFFWKTTQWTETKIWGKDNFYVEKFDTSLGLRAFFHIFGK